MAEYKIKTDSPFEDENEFEFGSLEREYRKICNQIHRSSYHVVEMTRYSESLLNEIYDGLTESQNKYLDALKRAGAPIMPKGSYGRNQKFNFDKFENMVKVAVQNIYGFTFSHVRIEEADGIWFAYMENEMIEYCKKFHKMDWTNKPFFKNKLHQIGYY